MSASVFLETWLFYSGFYYPLYFYGQGKLMQAGEIINLIIRDESIHGLYVGILSQEIYNNFNEALKEELKLWLLDLVAVLYETQNELVYELYGPVNLIHDVNNFVKYNANKALMNLGFDPFFNHENVNPIVLNGLNTETKTHDFFSMKGTGYQKMKTESLSDDDFNF
jgi:ribonucleoside-diphosphate reductase beta chain